MLIIIILNTEEGNILHVCGAILRKLLALYLSTHDIPSPREATSVAMRMGALPLRNSANTQSLSG